jgi:hypothetical protein
MSDCENGRDSLSTHTLEGNQGSMVQENGDSGARDGGMTIDRFQGLVLKLSNSLYVRCYYMLNYPHKPQILGIELFDRDGSDLKRIAPTKRKSILEKELNEMGFAFKDGVWRIERTAE